MTDAGTWLAEPEHPSLDTAIAARLDDPALPDRLTWNAFRTLAQWNTDVWVPSLLEVALGADNPLSHLSWADAIVEVWRSGLQLTGATDVLIESSEAVLLVEATFERSLGAEHLGAGADHALSLPSRGDRPVGFVLVTPGIDDDAAERLEDELAADLLDLPEGDGHGLREEALERIAGWMTWADLGALAIDLAEEADTIRSEMVHQLVTQLQERFPGIEV